MIREIKTAEDFRSEVLEQKGVTIVDFFADWCRPCKFMAPTIEAAAENLEGKVHFCKLNTAEFGEAADHFNITGIPTCIIFTDGKETGRIIGYRDKNAFMEAVEQEMESNQKTTE